MCKIILSRTRVLLADDHKAMLEHVTQLLEPEFEVVGAVRDGRAALEAVAGLHPDLLVLDVSMPVLSGLDAARELQRMGSQIKIVFLTVHEEPEFLRESFANGASAYVVKPRLATDLAVALREVLAGRSFVSPPLSQDNRE